MMMINGTHAVAVRGPGGWRCWGDWTVCDGYARHAITDYQTRQRHRQGTWRWRFFYPGTALVLVGPPVRRRIHPPPVPL